MAKLDKETFINSVKELNVLELNELVEGLKEEFGIDPNAVMAASSNAGGDGAAAASEASTVTVTLKDAGANKIQVIKLIKEITGKGLKDSKDIAEAGGAIKEDVPMEEAKKLEEQLKAAGATVELE